MAMREAQYKELRSAEQIAEDRGRSVSLLPVRDRHGRGLL
jgi:hypothetical protein